MLYNTVQTNMVGIIYLYPNYSYVYLYILINLAYTHAYRYFNIL